MLLVDLDTLGRPVGTYTGDERLLRALRHTATGAPPEQDALHLHPELARIAAAALQECAANGTAVVRDLPRGLAGVRTPMEVTLAPRKRLDGNGPDTYCLLIRDVGAGDSRLRMLKQLAQVATCTSNLVVVCDAQRRFEWVNPAFTEVTGYTLEEVRGRRPGELLQFHGTDPETVAAIRRALDAQQPIHAEILNKSKSGREYWLSLDIQPVVNDAGVLDGYIAVQVDVTEQRRQTQRLTELAEEASAARNALLTAVSALPDGFALFDSQERLVLFNERYTALHPKSAGILEPGITLEALLRNELAQDEYPEAQGQEDEWLAGALGAVRQGSGWRHELELADGRWVRSIKLRTSGRALIALRTDITQLKQAERSAVAQRVAAMDASQDGIAIADANGRLSYVNPALLDMFGRDSGHGLLGTLWTDLCHPSDRESVRLRAQQALSAVGVWRGVLRALRTDGLQFSQEVSITRAPDGTLVLISRDVSERLRHEEERYRLQETVILERVEHEAKLEGALVEMNRLHEREAQVRQASEMLVKALQSLSEAEDLGDGPRHLLQQLAQAMETTCAGLIPLGSEDEPLCLHHSDWWIAVKRNGELIDYLAKRHRRLIHNLSAAPICSPMADTWPEGPLAWMATAHVRPAKAEYLLVLAGGRENGLAQGRVHLFARFVPLLAEALRRRDDFMRARKLEQDLRQAQKLEALGTLAGGIAHEINTPMQYISDNLHFLKDCFAELLKALEKRGAGTLASETDNPELDHMLQEIPLALDQSLSGSRRVAEIVEAVRTFAYPELARDERFDLRGVLEHCLVITRSQWKHRVQMSLHGETSIGMIRGSPGQISQAFVNLMTNACDAARMSGNGQTGIVCISLSVAAGHAVVHVDDNGPGIPAALHDRIFDPFFTTKAVGKGTGQGLGICRSILERHGGSISHGESPLGGARFTVLLPVGAHE